MSFINGIIELFTTWEYVESMLRGLGTTLIISVLAAILGLVLGTLVAFVTIAKRTRWNAIPKAIAKVYITIIRGTPMALQLVTATLAFGINSGAYVAENIRAGILSVDIGQTEAGRALGLTNKITMVKVVIPQAIKNVIPAIGNELIALIKETSIVSMIGMYDLTMAAKIVGSGNKMASFLVPMTVAALFYLAIVYALTFVIKRIERRLRASDKR